MIHGKELLPLDQLLGDLRAWLLVKGAISQSAGLSAFCGLHSGLRNCRACPQLTDAPRLAVTIIFIAQCIRLNDKQNRGWKDTPNLLVITAIIIYLRRKLRHHRCCIASQADRALL